MLRTLKTVMRQDKEKFKIPKSVQQVIPIQTIWKDGIFLVWSVVIGNHESDLFLDRKSVV